MVFYLAFYKDNGAPEDCNVYYSYLIEADSKNEAKAKLKKQLIDWEIKAGRKPHVEMNQYDFEEMNVIR